MKKIVQHLYQNKTFLHLSILLAIALCIGIYLIVTTAIIAKDGHTFIKYAQHLQTAPTKTMLNEFQHPGYPFLILAAHKITAFLHHSDSPLSWIYSAQAAALLFRLLALTILFFLARHLLGARLAFWAVLIFISLPRPTELGSDALSDWPHLFFLLTAILLLLHGAINQKWYLFAFAGLVAGTGYLIRPECAQSVIAGSLWLAFTFLRPKPASAKIKTFSSLLLLLAGFAIVAAPYINLKGAIFPKKNVGEFSQTSQPQPAPANYQIAPQIAHASLFTSQFAPLKIAHALKQLWSNLGETLMWFFVPALFIGMYKWFKTQKWHQPAPFLITALIAMNIIVMIWLYCKYDYMAPRHTLPLFIIPILYVPLGLQEMALWLQHRFPKKDTKSGDKHFWFILLLIIGISICSPKLLRPIRLEKQAYRSAAQWLKNNTPDTAIIAVPDARISLYAQRTELVYNDENIPANFAYIVKVSQNHTEKLTPPAPSDKLVYEYIAKRKKSTNAAIYQRL